MNTSKMGEMKTHLGSTGPSVGLKLR